MDKQSQALQSVGEITYPWISIFIPYFIMDVITHPCWKSMSVREGPQGDVAAILLR